MSRKPRAIRRPRILNVRRNAFAACVIELHGEKRLLWIRGGLPLTLYQARRLHKWLAAAIEWMEEKERE